MKSIFKKESLIMTLVLVFYGFIAGGSVDFLFDSTYWKILGSMLFILIVVVCIVAFVKEQNRKKRIGLKEEFESKENDLDLTDKVGDDRIGIYFDKNREKIVLVSITTDGINKFYVEEFVKHIVKHSSYNYCALDDNRRKALLVQHQNGLFKYEVKYYGITDCNKDTAINNSIPTQLFLEFLPKNVDNGIDAPTTPTFIILEEKYGHVVMFNSLSIKSFNYISNECISKKYGETSYTTKKKIGSYVFFMDDFFKVLIVVSPLIPTQKVLNYSDIINVTYEEDGNTLFSKSMVRTVGGALVGGALIGGAGAIVGGLSGDTSQNKKVQSMSIKILVRSTTTPSVNLPINLIGETFNTKDEKSKKIYKTRIQEANAIKDLISVIIDNSSQQSTTTFTSSHQKNEEPKSQTGIADELVKLAQLKDAGVLSEEEFQQQKKKLLN